MFIICLATKETSILAMLKQRSIGGSDLESILALNFSIKQEKFKEWTLKFLEKEISLGSLPFLMDFLWYAYIPT